MDFDHNKNGKFSYQTNAERHKNKIWSLNLGLKDQLPHPISRFMLFGGLS
jgi:hypothetical protein